MICLPKSLSDSFIKALKTKEITPEKLSSMSSEERRNVLAQIIGKDNAPEVNALFEEKLLLKDQQAGMITWAKTVAGLKPEARTDIISKIEKLEKALNPTDLRSFLNDLANKKLGTEVTLEEAQKISQLAKEAKTAKDAITTGGDRMEYGRASVKLANYINELKDSNKPTILETAKNDGLQKAAGKTLEATAGTAKSLKATLDDSYIGHPATYVANHTCFRRKSFTSL